jgi:DNA-binding transcriptional MocR family regulator
LTVDLRFNYPTLPGLQSELDKAYLEMQAHFQGGHGGGLGLPIMTKELRALFSTGGEANEKSRVFVSNGANHSLLMVSMLLELANSYVVVDKLTYSGFIEIAKLLKVRLVPCPVDDEGMDPEELVKLCRKKNVKAVFVMGEIQNPYGWTINTKRKQQIVEIARKYGLSIIDDGSFSFLSPAGQSFMALAPEITFHVTSFSKSLDSRINLGLLYVPEAFERAMNVVLRLNSFSPKGDILKFVAYCCEKGIAGEIFERKRLSTYRRQLIAKGSLREFFPEADPFSSHLWVDLSGAVRPIQILDRLQERGILVLDSRNYSVGKVTKKTCGFRISLGNGLDEQQLGTALDKIYNILSAEQNWARTLSHI